MIKFATVLIAENIYSTVPRGQYPAQIVNHLIDPSFYLSGKLTPTTTLEWEILEGPFKGQRVNQYCTHFDDGYRRRSNLGKAIKLILERSMIAKGEKIDLNTLHNIPCIIEVDVKNAEQNTEYSKVTRIIKRLK